MSNFVFWVTLLLSIEVVAKIVALASGRMPERTPGAMAIDALLGIAFVMWGVYLLAK